MPTMGKGAAASGAEGFPLAGAAGFLARGVGEVFFFMIFFRKNEAATERPSGCLFHHYAHHAPLDARSQS
jgi:hypothetical protein